jgi:hypothetical protein
MAWREGTWIVNNVLGNSDGSVWWERTLRIVNDLIRHCADLEKDDRADDPYSAVYAATIKKLLICSLFELRSQFERIEKHLERHRLFTDRLRSKHDEFASRWVEVVRMRDESGERIDFSDKDLDLATLLERSEEFQDFDSGGLLELADAAEGLAHWIRAQLSESARTQDLY